MENGTMTADHPAVRAAAKWWADQLRDQQPSTAGDFMIDAMMAWAGKSEPKVDDEQADRFEGALRVQVSGLFANKPLDKRYPEILDVDYDPDRHLRSALLSAGLGRGLCPLPIKTLMWITPDEVRVRRGYGAAEQVVWAANEAVADESTVTGRTRGRG